MVNQILLSNPSLSSTSVKLLNGKFSYGWKNMVSADPSNGAFNATEVQYTGWENPIISLIFYIPVENLPVGTMTWALWNEYAKNQEIGTSATQTLLSVVVGNNDTAFISYANSVATSDIPVVIKTFNVDFSPADSQDAGFWTVKATLLETSKI